MFYNWIWTVNTGPTAGSDRSELLPHLDLCRASSTSGDWEVLEEVLEGVSGGCCLCWGWGEAMAGCGVCRGEYTWSGAGEMVKYQIWSFNIKPSYDTTLGLPWSPCRRATGRMSRTSGTLASSYQWTSPVWNTPISSITGLDSMYTVYTALQTVLLIWFVVSNLSDIIWFPELR